MITLLGFSLFMLPFSKTLSEAGWIVALFWWVALKIQKKEPFFKWDAIQTASVLFLAVVFLSWIQADRAFAAQSARGLWKWFKVVAIFWMCRDALGNPKASQVFTRAFLASMALVTFNGFYQMWHGVDLVQGYAVDIPGRLVRMRSSLPSPNDLATFYLLALPISAAAWLDRKRWSWQAAALVLLTGCFFLGLALTLSRSGFLAFGTAAAVFLALRGQKKALAALALGGLIFLASSTLLRENFLTSLRPSDETVGERLRYWRDSGPLLREKPFLGHGPNTYFSLFVSRSPSGDEYRGYAHNFIVQLWSDLGLAGLLIFLFPFFWRYSRPPPASGLPAALWVGLLAFWIQGLWDTNFFAFQGAHLFWAWWGVFCSEVSVRPITYNRA